MKQGNERHMMTLTFRSHIITLPSCVPAARYRMLSSSRFLRKVTDMTGDLAPRKTKTGSGASVGVVIVKILKVAT